MIKNKDDNDDDDTKEKKVRTIQIEKFPTINTTYLKYKKTWSAHDLVDKFLSNPNVDGCVFKSM